MNEIKIFNGNANEIFVVYGLIKENTFFTQKCLVSKTKSLIFRIL